jgi:hypothetical protein
VVVFNVVLLGLWLTIARGTHVPAARSTRVYALPPLDTAQGDRLAARLRALPGVHEVRVANSERHAYVTVDSARFDEENVARLIAGDTSP